MLVRPLISNKILRLTGNFCYARSISLSSTVMAQAQDKFCLPARYAGSEKSVWVEYIQLALDYKPLNLGQGFPDFAAPEYITKALSNVAASENVLLHQYTRGFGHPRLIAALANLYSQLIGRKIDPQTEILVTSGAYEALFATIIGHVDVGDEVIIIEPYFDCYEPMVKTAGGIPRFIPLRLQKTSSDGTVSSGDYGLDSKELESLFNSKTKAIIVNTPNNPLGKVFSENELKVIADLCKKWNVLCISDEVYEWMVYKPNKHIRIGKNSKYVSEAVALGFEKELTRLGSDECYFISLPRELEAKRDYMAKFLTEVGMNPIIPEGGYFMVANWSPLASRVDLTTEKDKYKDYRFTKWMTKNVGLQGIPTSAFYNEAHKSLTEDFVRYCFIKKDENLQKAAEILEKWKNSGK
ncbi:hypothetical protein ILUMI_21998 [Ignelater luminosus]|uniref:Aminotransferase class I/classII large domain-containing protein n=1 Tax=Ignelater luminosus TaxID=2038154 RepID=A0A8K0CFC4_IGNLU|nr:hypothetical protein ILUMI_21998 [Ignelater luminosus]